MNKVDGVLVQLLDGRTELRHRHCAEGELIQGDSPSPMQPNRNDYKTTAGYEREATRRRTCGLCGEEVPGL